MATKMVYKEVNECRECPYLRTIQFDKDLYECFCYNNLMTITTGNPHKLNWIPDWCCLPDKEE